MTDMSNWREPVRPQRELREFKLPLLHRFYLLVWTLLVSLGSVVYHLVPSLKTPAQWLETYTTWSMFQGELPYLDTVSRSGVFYQGLAALSQALAGPYLFLAVQALCLYLAGGYLYKMVLFLTRERALSLQFAIGFYLLQLAFGLGGFYPIQLASAFVLLGLWLLVTAYHGLRSDEVFIAYGLAAVLAIGFEPRTWLFWLLALVNLLVVNARRRLWARGFYQVLAMLFGGILLAYPAVYLMVNLQVLGPYLNQTLFAPLLLVRGQSLWLFTGRLAVLLASGLLSGLVFLPRFFGKMAEQQAILILLTLSSLAYLMIGLLSPDLGFSDLLLLVPFALLLTALAYSPIKDEGADLQLSRKSKQMGSGKGILAGYLFFPLVVLVFGLAHAAYHQMSHQAYFAQSQQVATYLADKTLSGEYLVVWDDNAQVYQATQTLSGTSRPLAVFGGKGSAQENLFVDEFLQGGSSYVLVNKSLPLPEAVHQELMAHYKPVTLEGIDLYTLYELD